MLDAAKPSHEEPGTSDHRCLCGSLLARVQARGVELKCRRCKRMVVIPWGAAVTWQEIESPCARTSESRTDASHAASRSVPAR